MLYLFPLSIHVIVCCGNVMLGGVKIIACYDVVYMCCVLLCYHYVWCVIVNVMWWHVCVVQCRVTIFMYANIGYDVIEDMMYVVVCSDTSKCDMLMVVVLTILLALVLCVMLMRRR